VGSALFQGNDIADIPDQFAIGIVAMGSRVVVGRKSRRCHRPSNEVNSC
jgi:hypothetical protein